MDMDSKDRESAAGEGEPSKADSSWTAGAQENHPGEGKGEPSRKWPHRSRAEWIVIGSLLVVIVMALGVYVYRASAQKPPPHGSMVRTDQRSLATAIEAYRVDNGTYPTWTTDRALKADWKSDVNMPTFRRVMPGGPVGLTTPIAYITSYVPDPLEGRREHRTFAYWVPPSGNGWILVSPGPDGVFDLDLASLETVYDPRISQPSLTLLAGGSPHGAYTYDPTNGTNSDGDVWRVHQ